MYKKKLILKKYHFLLINFFVKLKKKKKISKHIDNKFEEQIKLRTNKQNYL